MTSGQSSGYQAVIARITLPTPAPPIGWCNLQWPDTLTVVNTNVTAISDTIYGQIWIDGATSLPGPTPGLYAWVGYGPSNALPNAPSWSWTPAAFNVQVGNNDEFSNSFTIATYDPAQSGIMTVMPEPALLGLAVLLLLVRRRT